MVRGNDLACTQPRDITLAPSPCNYLVVDRSKMPPDAFCYMGTLPLKLLDAGDGIEVYAVHGDPP